MKFEEITDTIMRVIICLALLYLLFINFSEIVKFTNSRITLNTTSAKYINPSYDSLNLKYCNLYPMSESGKNVIDFENFKFLSIYLILFIIFWYNRIINIFSYTSLPNEIKILFYNKYYNYDIYKNCNNEYNLIYGFMIYILISLLFHSYVFYNEFNGDNVDDIKIHDNIKIMDTQIMENVDCDLLKKHDPKKNVYIDNNVLKTHLNGLGTNITSDMFLKICVAIILTDRVKKKTILDVNNLCNNSKCIYSKLENEIDVIFPESIEKYITDIEIALTDKSIILNLKDAIKTKYADIRKKLIASYMIIRDYKSSYLLYYKFGLLTIILGGILFSLFGLIYFGLIDFKWLNKYSNGGVYYPFNYYISAYKNIITYIITLISIYGAVIINF
jgi:hypothetical protein